MSGRLTLFDHLRLLANEARLFEAVSLGIVELVERASVFALHWERQAIGMAGERRGQDLEPDVAIAPHIVRAIISPMPATVLLPAESSSPLRASGRVGSSTATMRKSFVFGLTSYLDQKAPSRKWP